ncbi:MAG: MarP family serine protease [Nocardioides sp.]
MNLLDWLLVLLVVLYALSGYWQGFITGAFATAGLLVGGLIGVWLAPHALGDAKPSLLVSLGALFIVILAASLGQASMQFLGARLRERITWQPVRALDAVGGAALSAVAVLLVAWALGVALSGSGISGVTPLVRNSEVLARVNAALPSGVANRLASFNNVVGTTFFPRYLEPFAPERIVAVRPGPARLLHDPDVTRDQQSVVKLRSTNSCGRGIEGTGFVFAQDRVMTNAHVVAGVTHPVLDIDGSSEAGTVVYYNPDVDVAVVAVPTGQIPQLDFDQTAESKQGAAILGYPENGPYDVQVARIRADQRLRSPDIYGEGTVLRDVFSLRGLVRPGNSGGPIVSSRGKVLGVVFAASVTSRDTGYALSAKQVAPAAMRGTAATRPVPTGDCVS